MIGLEIDMSCGTQPDASKFRGKYTQVSHLDHGNDIDALLLVFLGNILGSQETGLLSRVPVELNRAGGAESSSNKGAEDLQDSNSARTIVIRTGGAEHREPHVDRVLVSTNNDGLVSQRIVLALKAS